MISVIIPVKNGEKYLQDAIDGIKAQGMDVEIIVVDDASTDSTAQIAAKAGCKVVRHETGKGQVAGKNTGLANATGEYVMFHDADDIMRPGALKALFEALEADSSIFAAEAMVKDFVSEELSEEQKSKCIAKPEPFYGLFTGAILMRRSVFETIGPLPENVHTGEIIYWQSKMDENHFTVKKLNLVSTDRRIHTANFGQTNRRNEFKDYAAILRMRMKKS